MEEARQLLNLLMGINGFAALIWLIAALGAFASYRAFKQFPDLGWTATFVLFSATRVGHVWEALRWRDNLLFLNERLVSNLNDVTRIRVAIAALELVAVLLLLFFYRARRSMA